MLIPALFGVLQSLVYGVFQSMTVKKIMTPCTAIFKAQHLWYPGTLSLPLLYSLQHSYVSYLCRNKGLTLSKIELGFLDVSWCWYKYTLQTLEFLFPALHPCPFYSCLKEFQFYVPTIIIIVPSYGGITLHLLYLPFWVLRSSQTEASCKTIKKCMEVKGEGKRTMLGLKTYRWKNSGFSGLILIFRPIDWRFHICVPDVCLVNP